MKPFFPRIFLIFSILPLSVLVATYAFAEKINLKSGQVIEGKIVEETDKYFRIEVSGVTVTYPKEFISSIEGRPFMPAKSRVAEEHPEVKRLQGLIQKEPDNYEHYLELAGFYAGTGDGDLAVEYVEKALQLNSQAAIAKDAYMIAAMGSYYAGKPKQSYEYTKKALQANAEDKLAKNFKDMLDSVSKQSWGGNLPEKISWHGYDNVAELHQANIKKGVFRLGDKEDSFISDNLRFRVASPVGWSKATTGGDATWAPAPTQIIYKKFKDQQRSATIIVTQDNPNPEHKTVFDFASQVKRELMKQIPRLVVIGPTRVTLVGRSASRMDMRDTENNLHMEWYQLGISGVIITFEYLNTLEQFEVDHNVFKKLLDSLIIKGGQ